MSAQRVYLSIGYDRYHEQQKAVTQRLGVYGSVLRSVTNAMTAAGNGGTPPSRVGFIEGQWLVLETTRQRVVLDLSTADLRFGFVPVTTASDNRAPVQVPAGKRPAIALRPRGDDQWFTYPLFDITGAVIPGQQMQALADAIASVRGPDDAAAEVVKALRSLADDPFAQYQ